MIKLLIFLHVCIKFSRCRFEVFSVVNIKPSCGLTQGRFVRMKKTTLQTNRLERFVHVITGCVIKGDKYALHCSNNKRSNCHFRNTPFQTTFSSGTRWLFKWLLGIFCSSTVTQFSLGEGVVLSSDLSVQQQFQFPQKHQQIVTKEKLFILLMLVFDSCRLLHRNKNIRADIPKNTKKRHGKTFTIWEKPELQAKSRF